MRGRGQGTLTRGCSLASCNVSFAEHPEGFTITESRHGEKLNQGDHRAEITPSDDKSTSSPELLVFENTILRAESGKLPLQYGDALHTQIIPAAEHQAHSLAQSFVASFVTHVTSSLESMREGRLGGLSDFLGLHSELGFKLDVCLMFHPAGIHLSKHRVSSCFSKIQLQAPDPISVSSLFHPNSFLLSLMVAFSHHHMHIIIASLSSLISCPPLFSANVSMKKSSLILWDWAVSLALHVMVSACRYI